MSRLTTRIVILMLVAALALAAAGWRNGGFVALWLTPDQQGRWAYERLDFSNATDRFEDPMWKGRAGYAAGRYEEAAAAFGRLPTAQGFFNRGNALMKAREYSKAITAYEQAVADAPEWSEAAANLELARYVLDYIEKTREQTDTGNETELGADDFVFDNTRERG
ncbi:MAG: tetratricopeptide repeat protein, partial [Gammaproteobacteria bacterium]|nr:tetratricopeptide repeat protein [Gammaproteobacteria bacterium]